MCSFRPKTAYLYMTDKIFPLGLLPPLVSPKVKVPPLQLKQQHSVKRISATLHRHRVIGPILWGHSGPLCHALSLSLLSLSSLLSWTSMRRQRATVAVRQ